MTTYYRQTAKFSIKQNVVVYLKIVVYSLLLLEIVNLTIICSTFYQNCDVGVRAEHAILAGAGAESRARLEVLKRSAGALFWPASALHGAFRSILRGEAPEHFSFLFWSAHPIMYVVRLPIPSPARASSRR